MWCSAQEREDFVNSHQHTQSLLSSFGYCEVQPVSFVFSHKAALWAVCVVVVLAVSVKLMKHNMQHLQAGAVLG